MRFEKRTPELRLKLEGWRSRLVLVLAIGGFAVLAGRAFYLQALNTAFLQAKGEARYSRVVEMPASRGPVKDRNGQMLNQTGWFTRTLAPNVPDRITVNSMGPRAADFQMDFRWAH